MPESLESGRLWHRHWPSEVPKTLSYPDISLGRMLALTAERSGPRTAICYLDTDMTYARLWDLTLRLAASLDGLGLKKGDACALMLPNSPQFLISFFACQLLGLPVTAVNPTFKSLEVRHQLCDSRAKALILLDAMYPEAVKGLAGTEVATVIGTNAVDLCGFSKLKVWLGKKLKKLPYFDLPAEVLKFTDLLRAEPRPPQVAIDPKEDVAVLQYTGGTTGLPKGAMLTHFNLVANVCQCQAWLPQGGGDFGVIGVLPVFHIYGMTTVMNFAVRVGAKMLLFPKPPLDLSDLCRRIQKYAPRDGWLFPGVAVLYNRINNFPKVGRYDLSSVKLCISGAGPLPQAIQTRFEALTGARLIEGYGLTEASPVTHANPPFGRRKLGTIGLPFPDTDVKIVDRDDRDKELPPLPFAVAETGGLTKEQAEAAEAFTGELAVKGPQVMKGYFDQPEDTAGVLRHGWLLTGDIACLDAEGYTIIRDRAKDMIKYKGHAVFPAEVEDFLHQHPAVRSAAVIGLPQAELGEIVKAFVVLKPEARGRVRPEDIIEWARGTMTSYKVPKEVEFRDELPTTMVGKVLRRVLKEEELKKKQTP